jgi:hypothetical protein
LASRYLILQGYLCGEPVNDLHHFCKALWVYTTTGLRLRARLVVSLVSLIVVVISQVLAGERHEFLVAELLA